MTNTPHVPVLLNEVISSFEGLNGNSKAWFVDGTFGRGGHSKAMLERHSNLNILALDIDEEAIEHGKRNFKNSSSIHFYQCDFSEWPEVVEHLHSLTNQKNVDGILLDLGVSSPQLDDAHRGFSFYKDGPLDMRMDLRSPLTAKEVVNTYSEEELLRIFREYGEIKSPKKVVDRILEARAKSPIETTLQLAQLIEGAMGWRKKGFHPATQFFMALRLEVNRELSKISDVISRMIESLNDGGILSVITFHSLEDRIVKYKFKEHLDVGNLLNKKVIKPSRAEEKSNPRSRSSKLRTFVKGKTEVLVEQKKYPSKYREKLMRGDTNE